jgi:beta-lactamase class A
MVILSVGVGVLAGTCLSVLDPASRIPIVDTPQIPVKTASVNGGGNTPQNAPVPSPTSPVLAQELVLLKATVQTLISQSVAQSPQLSPGAFFVDLDTNAYMDVKGNVTVAAASTIKVPVLIAFFQDVDAGKIRLEELLTLRKELVGGGSGEMQYQSLGTQYSALETATKMITISDNTATNLLIARLGGIAALNQRFKSWGLTATIVNNLLPDLAGTNTTSPKELAILMARISQGELVSIRSRDRLLDIMRKTYNDSLLPRGLEEGATIAHKTGDIGTLVGDVGLIDLPNGKRYAAAVLVKCVFNDPIAPDLIRQISRATAQFFSRPPAANPASRADNEAPKNPDGSSIDPSSTASSSSER